MGRFRKNKFNYWNLVLICIANYDIFELLEVRRKYLISLQLLKFDISIEANIQFGNDSPLIRKQTT